MRVSNKPLVFLGSGTDGSNLRRDMCLGGSITMHEKEGSQYQYEGSRGEGLGSFEVIKGQC